MTYNVFSGTLHPTHSLTHSLTEYLGECMAIYLTCPLIVPNNFDNREFWMMAVAQMKTM